MFGLMYVILCHASRLLVVPPPHWIFLHWHHEYMSYTLSSMSSTGTNESDFPSASTYVWHWSVCSSTNLISFIRIAKDPLKFFQWRQSFRDPIIPETRMLKDDEHEQTHLLNLLHNTKFPSSLRNIEEVRSVKTTELHFHLSHNPSRSCFWMHTGTGLPSRKRLNPGRWRKMNRVGVINLQMLLHFSLRGRVREGRLQRIFLSKHNVH